MQHPDEGTIHAWVDGQLAADEAAAFEGHLAECPECSALVAEARGLVAASSRIVSALDIVPGDVIPKTAPRRRPWYASTQLRAAAALVIVAGASLVVMRRGGVKQMETAVQSSAVQASAPGKAPTPVVEKAQVDTAMMEQASPAAAPGVSELDARKNSLKKKTEIEQVPERRSKNASDAAAEPRAPEVLTDASARINALSGKVSGINPQARRDSSYKSRFNSLSQLDQVVVTGVAVATAPENLKKLRTDSAESKAVYEVSPGVEVTLIDQGPVATVAMSRAVQSKERQATAPVPTSPTPPPAAQSATGSAMNAVVTNTITWTDKRGHVMVLVGPLSKAALEAARQRLPADMR